VAGNGRYTCKQLKVILVVSEENLIALNNQSTLDDKVPHQLFAENYMENPDSRTTLLVDSMLHSLGFCSF
jgi:hypothetical protein